MNQTHGQRKSVTARRQKFLALSGAASTAGVVRDLREWRALDTAMIESGICGLLAMVKDLATHEIVPRTLHAIPASRGNPASAPSSSCKKR